MAHLKPEPKHPSIVIPPEDLGTIHHVGFVHDPVAMFGNTHRNDAEDEVIRDFMIKHDIFKDFPRDAFSRIRETHWGANKGVLKYSGYCGLPKVAEPLLKRARALMFKQYEPYAGTCEVLGEDDVEMVADSHCGVEYRLLGFKKKSDVLRHPVACREVIDSWHNPDYPSLWKISVKSGELLKKKKIDINDPRIFIVGDIKYHYRSIRMFTNIHELLKRLAQEVTGRIKLGYTFQFGGFTRLMDYLAKKYGLIIEGDVTKWDSGVLEFMFIYVLFPLFTMLHKPNEYCSHEEFLVRMYYQFRDAIHSILIMPSGQVLVKHVGNPSGWLLTGDVNCLCHEFDIVLLYVVNDLDADLRRDQWWLLGDDHIAGITNPTLGSYEVRARLYKAMNSDLSLEKDYVSNTVDGHTFLGFKAVFSSKYGRYVPVFDMTKALCSALRPGGKVDPALRYARLTGLRILTFFHPLYRHIEDLARDCYQDGLVYEHQPVDLDDDTARLLLTWPRNDTIERLWLGYESGGTGGGLSEKVSLVKLLNFI